MRSLVVLTVCLWLFKANAAVAAPATKESARSLAYAGIEAYAVADYLTANDKLERAFQLMPLPSFGLWSARTLIKLGRLIDAEQRYRAILSLDVAPSEPAVQHSAKADAARELVELLPRIPSLAIDLRGATFEEVECKLDGTVIVVRGPLQPLRLDPGRHVVVCTRDADRAVELVTLAEADRVDIVLPFPEIASEAPRQGAGRAVALPEERPAIGTAPSLRMAGWIAIGAGGAGVLTGVLAHVLASGERTTVLARSDCMMPSCYANTVAAYDSYSAWRAVRLTAFLSGGLASVAGVTLLIAADEASEPSPKELSLRIGPTAAWLHGTF